MIHELKAWPDMFEAIRLGDKRFEYRADDRKPRYEVGDTLRLREFTPHAECWGSGRVRDHTDTVECGCPKPHGTYTGRDLAASVTYVMRETSESPCRLQAGWCIMSLNVVRWTATCDTCDGKKEIDDPDGIRVCWRCAGRGTREYVQNGYDRRA